GLQQLRWSSASRSKRRPLASLCLRQKASGVAREVGGKQHAWKSQEDEQHLGQDRIAPGRVEGVGEGVDHGDLPGRATVELDVELHHGGGLEDWRGRHGIDAQRRQDGLLEDSGGHDQYVRYRRELTLVVGGTAREEWVGAGEVRDPRYGKRQWRRAPRN